MRDVRRSQGVQRRVAGKATRSDHQAHHVFNGGINDTTALTPKTRVRE